MGDHPDSWWQKSLSHIYLFQTYCVSALMVKKSIKNDHPIVYDGSTG